MITSKRINTVTAVLMIAAVLLTCFSLAFPHTETASAAAVQSQLSYPQQLFSSTMMTVDIAVNESDWNTMLENALNEEYISCDVTINGVLYSSVGIRPKGNSSLTQIASDSTTDRYSFKLEFDHYLKNQTCCGLDKLVLNNVQSDTTYMKEYLSYQLMDFMGVTSPLYTFASITVNGESWGFYIAVEALEESFALRNYGTDYGQLYKPEGMEMAGGGNEAPGDGFQPGNGADQNGMPQMPANGEGQNGFPLMPDSGDNQNGMPQTPANGEGQSGFPQMPDGGDQNGMPQFGGMGGSSGGSSLVYTDDNPESYSDIFDNAVFDTTDSDKQRVITALQHLNEGTDLEQYVDVDQVLRYFAANTVLVNLDSYVSSLQHNYYLYEKDGIITILPWDFNLSFGAFQSGTASAAVNFPIDTPVSGVALSERPLLGKLLEVEEYKERYHQYLQEIVDGYFNSGLFETTIDQLNAQISSYVQQDPSAFYTYEEYQAGVAMLKQFGALRAQSVQGQLDGTIPSTTDGQSSEPSTLVDASSIDLTVMGMQGGGGDMGQMGGGMMGGPGGMNGNQDDTPANAQPGESNGENGTAGFDGPPNREQGGFGANVPDQEVLQQAMEIIAQSNGELTEEQLSQLTALGLTEEQISMLQNMAQGFGGGRMEGQGGPDGGFGENGRQPGGTISSDSIGTVSRDWLLLSLASVACLIPALLFVILFRRRRYAKGSSPRWHSPYG